MQSKEAYFDYLTRRLDSGESQNVAIFATADSIERQLRGKERVRVLDIGCFSGAMLNRIMRELPENLRDRVDMFGVDSDVEAMDHGRKKYGNIDYQTGDVEEGVVVEGLFDVIVLVNILHELYTDEPLETRRGLISEVFVGVANLLSNGGEVILLDGLRPDDPNQAVEVEMVGEKWVDKFERLQREYKATELNVERVEDCLVRTDALSLAVFITKARYLGESFWEGEADQLYQYNSQSDFRKMVEEAGLQMVSLEPQSLKSEAWEEMIVGVSPTECIPAKNVLLVAKKS